MYCIAHIGAIHDIQFVHHLSIDRLSKVPGKEKEKFFSKAFDTIEEKWEVCAVPENKAPNQMKIAELNIGLSSKSLGEITPEHALRELVSCGFKVITYRTQESVSNDGKETCFACKVELPQYWQTLLENIAKRLGQDCIAVVGFIGQSPYDTFAPEFWVKPEPTEAERFIDYLQSTLIPDLKESGYECTAEDFETLISFYLNK